jgi:hypothetical protein
MLLLDDMPTDKQILQFPSCREASRNWQGSHSKKIAAEQTKNGHPPETFEAENAFHILSKRLKIDESTRQEQRTVRDLFWDTISKAWLKPHGRFGSSTEETLCKVVNRGAHRTWSFRLAKDRSLIYRICLRRL